MGEVQSFRLNCKRFYILLLLSKGKGAYLERFFHYHSEGRWARSHEQKHFKEKNIQNIQILLKTQNPLHTYQEGITTKLIFSNVKSIGKFRQSLQTIK